MANENQNAPFSEGHRLWRSKREEEDRWQKEFYEELNFFPNLISMKRLLCDAQRTQALLARQEIERDGGDFQYELEKVRCDNLIIFFLYVLGRKQEAMEYSEYIKDDQRKSIIFLTLKAMMQWEFNLKSDCSDTMAALQRLSETHEHNYLLAVAESEIGHFLICIGPKVLVCAMDMLQKAIGRCSNEDSDTFLWKYDLALAIRRNFNAFAHSEHPECSSLVLAKKAADLLTDIAQNCLNKVYKARAQVELGRLIICLKGFARFCKEEDKVSVESFCEGYQTPRFYMAAAFGISGEDYYVLRECGRQLLNDKKLDKARHRLEDAYKNKKDSIVCQLLGKLNIRMCSVEQEVLNSIETRGAETTEDQSLMMACKGSSPKKNTGPRIPDISWHESAEETKLIAEFENNPFMNPDGSRKTTQPCGTGIIIPPHQWPNITSGCKSVYENFNHSRPSLSSSPGKIQYTAEECLQHLLKSKVHDVYYEAEDYRIQAAERFFLEGLKYDPRNHALLCDTGLLYDGIRKPAEALKYYGRIISDKELASPLLVVTAYTRSGLCNMELREYCESDLERETFTRRAEDMFMASLLECRYAAAPLPQVSDKRAIVWESYSEILKLLQQSESYDRKEKEAKVHYLVGNYPEAIKVYTEAMDLADTRQGRIEAVHGRILNHLRMNNVKDAKFILDLFLTSDEREFILTNDDETTRNLRDVAVEVNKTTAGQALESGNMADAHSAFRWALVLKKILQDPVAQQSLACADTAPRQDVADMLEKFDSCVFYDTDSPTDELRDLSEAVAFIMRTIFGMRVSVNDEGVTLGHLSFDSELRLAESAPLAILVIAPGSQLSPRMTYIVDTVLQSHDQSRILPILVGEGTTHLLPKPLHCLQHYSRSRELLSVGRSDVRDHVSEVCHLFDALLEGTQLCPFE